MSNGEHETLETLRSLSRDLDYVVMELAASSPGNVRRMAQMVRPDVAIVTLVGMEHYSTFRGKDAVAREKGALVEALSPRGFAVLNGDDPRVRAMTDLTRARVVTFGTADADYVRRDVTSLAPGRTDFALCHDGRSMHVRTALTGAYNALAVQAAAACAIELGVPERIVVERIATFSPLFGRMSVHAIDGGPIFIADMIKAPYESIALTTDFLRDCVAPRKRFILGQISDYAGDLRKKYRDTYRAALSAADQVIFVGPNSHRSSATAEDIAAGRFMAFHSVRALSDYIKSSVVAGEVILLKSSINLHLERLVLDWTTDIRCWQEECGVKQDCLRCGLYDRNFSEHRGRIGMRRKARERRQAQMQDQEQAVARTC